MKSMIAMTALGASMMLGGVALAQSDDSAQSVFIPEGYELTGESRTCLSTRVIDDIDTSHENAWIVTMTNRDKFLTRVSNGCSAATSPFTYISYQVSGSQLCRGEIVRVIDQGTHSAAGSCGIGEFEELGRLPEDAS
ncbi:hypothetical protein ACFELO_05050 [Oceanicaulis sp. LC35]|uniref:hypothetical protein n=1 Tax=Oceanicaulis sp. LC35 TaxID=3349635 RepID=UPI003F87805B